MAFVYVFLILIFFYKFFHVGDLRFFRSSGGQARSREVQGAHITWVLTSNSPLTALRRRCINSPGWLITSKSNTQRARRYRQQQSSFCWRHSGTVAPRKVMRDMLMPLPVRAESRQRSERCWGRGCSTRPGATLKGMLGRPCELRRRTGRVRAQEGPGGESSRRTR